MLARMRTSDRNSDVGFTLIELLVVIIIIGILAAIAIPVFLNQRKKAVDASIKSDLRSVANEMETYNVDNQAYPASVTASTATSATLTLGTASGITLTAGNVVSVVVNTAGVSAAGTAYAVCGFNAKATANVAGSSFVYVSNQGGLKPVRTTCPGAATF
jgi:type IV pilus assembly protein PilA